MEAVPRFAPLECFGGVNQDSTDAHMITAQAECILHAQNYLRGRFVGSLGLGHLELDLHEARAIGKCMSSMILAFDENIVASTSLK